MNSNDLLPYLLSGVIIPSGSLFAQKASPSGTEKPNIIYILADDLGYGDLSCYGQKKFQTPHIDSLAAQGMKFTSHYAGCTVSAPSRASLMTGLHTGHTPIRGNKGENTPYGTFDSSLPSLFVTVAECLKKQNYTTGCVGKWGMGGPGTQGHPNNQGFDYFYGHLSQLDAHFYYPEYLFENEKKIELNKQFYSQDLFLEKASRFITDNKNKPFFLYFAVTIPHAELVVPEEYASKYAGKFEDEPWGKPGGQHYGYTPHKHASFAGMIDRLDGDVGKIRQLLKDLGIDRNTLIIFTSDNGPHKEGGADPDFFNSGGGYKGYKRDLYEGGIRVPMIACWPGKITSGKHCDHPSAFWDFLPTACEISGASLPENIDGISYLPSLLGKKQKKHPYLYWEFHEYNGTQAVRMGKWKAIRLKASGNPDAPIELYDLNNDPGETRNVAAQHQDIVRKMDQLLREAHQEDPEWPFFNN